MAEDVKDISTQEVDPQDGGKATPSDGAQQETDYKSLFSELSEEFPEVESPGELKKVLKSYGLTQKKLQGMDIDELLRIRDEREEVIRRAEKRRLKELEENETPEETIARLKKEKKEEQKRREHIERMSREKDQARQGVRAFDQTVKGVLDGSGLSKAEINFLKAEATSRNDILSVKYDSPAEVKRFAKAKIDALKKLKEQIIKEYESSPPKKGPVEVPSNTGAASESKPTKFASPKDRRAAMVERLRAGGWGK